MRLRASRRHRIALPTHREIARASRECFPLPPGSRAVHNVAVTARPAALAAAVVAVALAGAAVGLTVSVGWSFAQAVDSFVVSNLVIGLPFALCGALIAWHRPHHVVGWLYAVGGCAQLITAFTAPLAQQLSENGASSAAVRAAITVCSWAWPVHIGICLPLSLLLLPDGRLPSRAWRPVAWAVGLTSPLFVVEVGTTAGPLSPGLPQPWGVLPRTGGWSVLWTASEARWAVTMLLGVVALVVRYRSGDDALRQQLLWLLGAAATVLVAVTPWALVSGTPIVVLFAIPLLPIAIAVAIVRHGLLDVRVVLARGLSYALLSALVLAGYVLLVLALSGVVSALVVALLAFPLRARLQQVAERIVYGDRDPFDLASRVGERLVDLPGSLAEIRVALQLTYVGISLGDETVASAGDRPVHVENRPLRDGAELVVGPRSGESSLGRRDEKVLDLLSGPLAVALHATLVSRDLQQSRERLVAAREEERRRLRRDLHDGLGPLLTGVALAADAAANLAERDPGRTRDLLTGVRTDIRTAIGEVRRAVEDLRPPALAELGLAGALQARAAQTVRRADGTPLAVTVDAVFDMELPAAIEVAAYRIATEALNNAVRHSGATTVRLRLRATDDLVVEVVDDGDPGDEWHAGVGITAMRERAAELGGACEVGPSPEGGAVRARLPLAFA